MALLKIQKRTKTHDAIFPIRDKKYFWQTILKILLATILKGVKEDLGIKDGHSQSHDCRQT